MQVSARRLFSLRVPKKSRASRIVLHPSRENDPFIPPFPPAEAKVVDPLSFVPSTTVAVRQPFPARGDMTVETFLKTIGRGVEELAPKFTTWDEFSASTGEELKKKGIAVRKRRWILAWVEKYRQGVDPFHIPLVSRAKKNKFLSRRKPKTKAEKKRKD